MKTVANLSERLATVAVSAVQILIKMALASWLGDCTMKL